MRKQMSMKRMTPRERRQKRITLLRAFYSELEEYERLQPNHPRMLMSASLLGPVQRVLAESGWQVGWATRA